MSCAALRRVFTGCNKLTYHITRSGTFRYKVMHLNENTVTGRLLIHLNKAKDLSDPTTSVTIQNATDKTPSSDKHNSYQRNKMNEIRSADVEYCLRTKDMDVPTIFNILHSYMSVPHKIVSLKFYESAISHLYNSLEFLTLPERLKLMFYIGLEKKTKNSQKLMKSCLRTLTSLEIESLCIEDLCVVCNSSFKTSTKIQNVVLLNKIIDTLNENLHVLKDPGLFITLLKSLRHNRFQNEDILSTITCTVLFNSTFQCYSFVNICHILAAYVDHLYYDEPILKLFAERGVELLEASEIMGEYIRAKDINRFLWAYSCIGYKFDAHIFSHIVVPKMMERLNNGYYKDDPELLVDSVLYMWILNYQAVELVPYCFHDENIELIRERKTKTNHRLNLLLICMQLENLPLYKKIHVKPQNFQNSKMQQQILLRPNLHRVYNGLIEILPQLEIDKFEFECQIPHLNIVGITGYKKIYKSVFIEVLDDYVCMKNQSSSASGLMQLKLRLIQRMDQGLVIISTEDVKGLTDVELQKHLLDEISMVC